MAVDTATTIAGFDTAKPAGTDPKSEGDDNIRHVKSVLKTTFPNVAGAVTPTHTEMNRLTGLASSIAVTSFPLFTDVVQIGATMIGSYVQKGLCIDQGGFDNEIISLRSSDVATGMTTNAETSTFGSFAKYHATSGGTIFHGYSSATVGLFLRGAATTEDSTRSTAAVAAVMIDGTVKSGTTIATKGANTNILVVRDGSSAKFIFDSDGDSHQDVGTAWTNFDHLDDVATLDALAYNVARADDPIKRKFGEWMNERRDALTEQNLVRFNDDGHHFVNMSKLTMLHTGAIRQMGEKLDAALKTIENLTLRLENKNA